MPDDAKATTLPELSAAWDSTCAAMLSGNERTMRWLQGMFGVAEECTRFAHERWREDMAAWSALAACRTPAEAIEWQSRVVTRACEHYGEEAAKLSQLLARCAGS
jgi:phasin protein